MSGSCFWHLVGNQYFPFGLHNKFYNKHEELFKPIQKLLNPGKELAYERKVLPFFRNYYEIRDRIMMIKDKTFKFARYAITQGSPQEKQAVDEILPSKTQNGASNISLDSISTRSYF